MAKKTDISAAQADQRVDEGQSVLTLADAADAQRWGADRAAKAIERKRITVDFPGWMISALDHRAQELGVTRQSVIKTWIGERAEEMQLHHSS
jgi:hypothetical protein